MNDVLLDRLELSFLSGLQDQREVQQRVREQTRIGLGMAQANANGQQATKPPEAEDMGIVNRSPTTHSHYYMAPVVEPVPPSPKTANPWPWAALITAMVLAAALAGFLLLREGRKPQPAPVNPGQYGLGLDDLKVF